MKRFKTLLFSLVLLTAAPSFAAGGDVIGGGDLLDLEFELQLSPDERVFLKRKPPMVAFNKWQGTLTPKEKQDMLKKIYKEFVLPQLKKNKEQ